MSVCVWMEHIYRDATIGSGNVRVDLPPSLTVSGNCVCWVRAGRAWVRDSDLHVVKVSLQQDGYCRCGTQGKGSDSMLHL